MNILITGDRNWTDQQIIYEALKEFEGQDVTIIHGAARGADFIAGSIAKNIFDFEVKPFPAKWHTYGKSAGPIRNSEMLESNEIHKCLAFHNDIQNSKGTKDMIQKVKKAGISGKLYTTDYKLNIDELTI